jgi:hypothetical protein
LKIPFLALDGKVGAGNVHGDPLINACATPARFFYSDCLQGLEEVGQQEK